MWVKMEWCQLVLGRGLMQLKEEKKAGESGRNSRRNRLTGSKRTEAPVAHVWPFVATFLLSFSFSGSQALPL